MSKSERKKADIIIKNRNRLDRKIKTEMISTSVIMLYQWQSTHCQIVMKLVKYIEMNTRFQFGHFDYYFCMSEWFVSTPTYVLMMF